MIKFSPVKINELALVVLGDDSNHYLKGQQLVELFNILGYEDDYVWPSVGISTKDIGESLSRKTYVKARLKDLNESGKIAEFIDAYEDFTGYHLADSFKSKSETKEIKPNIVVDKRNIIANSSQNDEISDKVVFISYSWDSEAHKAWVKKLADDLRERGFNVLFDEYQPLGTPLTPFMMDGITKADKVLIIGTPLYKEKAESHKGGANVEDQIINIHISHDFNDPKFIPILREGTYETSFTNLVGDRKGFSFLEGCDYKETFDKLVGALCRKSYTITSSAQSILSTAKFEQVYIPYFDVFFDRLDMANYCYWMNLIAVDGCCRIRKDRYNALRELADYMNACQKVVGFEQFYELVENLRIALTDMLNVFDLHSKLIGEDTYDFHKFYNDHHYDSQLNPIEEQQYIDEILLIADIAFEVTRIANLLLKRIRNYVPGFMAKYGVLTIIDSTDVNSNKAAIEFIDELKDKNSPYPGIITFLDERSNRNHHYGSGHQLLDVLQKNGIAH